MSIQYWSGTKIDKLEENEIFVFGSNPQGINGAGAAKAAMNLSKGAKHGVGRGFNGSNAYALVTKSLKAGFLEKSTGILYDKEGYCSVSPEQIRANIDELYDIAKKPEHLNKRFLITYQYETWPNGTPKKSLNGYTSQEILEMFVKDKDIPPNIVFHESYKLHLEKLYNNQNKALKSGSTMNTADHNPPASKNMEYTYFFHLKSPFSNFHPSKFEYKELVFLSNEQFMMYSKAKNFHDEETALKILNINESPLAKKFLEGALTRESIVNDKNLSDQWNQLMMNIKKLGKSVQGYDDAYWASRRVKIVLFGARLKFNQNPELKEILMNTGSSKLVECSPYDKIWGIGLSVDRAKKTPEEQWPGTNLLGIVLNKLKEEFLLESKKDNKLKMIK